MIVNATHHTSCGTNPKGINVSSLDTPGTLALEWLTQLPVVATAITAATGKRAA